jgi:hypothetical protein
MRHLNRLAFAMTVLGVTAATGVAQQVPLPTGTTTTPNGIQSTTTTGNQTGGQTGQMGQTGPSTNAFQLQQFEAPPQITAPTGTGGSLDASNFLSGYYASPYYSGTITNANSGTLPGGFGTPLYGTGTGGGGLGGAGGRTGGRTATGLGGQAGRLGGLGGQRGLNTANQSGTVIPMQVNIAYRAVPNFDITPMPAAQVQADVSGMLARSVSQIPTAANVQVVTDGNTVTLRGTVASADDARLIEGMTRLTPGVRAVRNELTFPASTTTGLPAFPR